MSDDDQSVEELKARIEELEETVDDLQQQQPDESNRSPQNVTRRSVLGSALGVATAGTAGYYFGVRRASAAPNWSNTDGQYGTESQPLTKTIAREGVFQTLSTVRTDVDETASVITQSSSNPDQTIPGDGTETQLKWEATVEDGLGGADLSDNQIVIPRDGVYAIRVSMAIRSSVSDAFLRINRNGSLYRQRKIDYKTFDTRSVEKTQPLSQGDTITATLQQSSGSGVDTVGDGKYTGFSAVKLD